ncbi:MAG: MogA/MoaB family molybdenum cofactor biosynthesis protein [Actinobacteria bacterium]|nr:MogA/MoaB family molybdenum cofactor biosynthesis protein [Actinomycetota bacterium]
MRACVLTVSDGVFHGAREDGSGDLLAAKAEAAGFSVVERAVVPDEAAEIVARVAGWCDAADAVELVLVTGGTGFAPRDVTPEALRGALERLAPGLDEAMRAFSMRAKPHGMLSRGASGIRGRTLVVSFPGSPRACDELFDVVEPVLAHAVGLLRSEPTEHL